MENKTYKALTQENVFVDNKILFPNKRNHFKIINAKVRQNLEH